MARRTAPASPARQRGDGTRGRLRVVLGDAGLDEDRFVEAAISALEELRGGGLSADRPATQFSPDDAAALRAGGLDLAPRTARDPDPVSTTAARYAALLADSADVAEVAERLGVTRARVRQRAQERTLLAIREGDEWRFPRGQFTAGAAIRGLPAVALALPRDLHPVAAWTFLNEPSSDLAIDDRPATPLDWLRSGGSPDPVAAIAREL